MSILHRFEPFLVRLPEVERPRYVLLFRDRMKWVGLVLLVYFLLMETSLYGLSPSAVDIFENVRAVMAGGFGSLISLGIGPIVSASIILQIMVGGKLIDLDLSKSEDKRIFMGTQKALAIAFTIFESAVMVLFGALPAATHIDPATGRFADMNIPEIAAKAVPLLPHEIFNLQLLLIAQLTLGGLLIIYLDEVVSRWGIGSGIGLFIVGGVCSQVIIGSFNPLPATKGELVPAGRIPAFLYMLSNGQTNWNLLVPILGFLVLFAVVVYVASIRVEIPLTYGRFRGARGRYPIKFIYANVIPVIFASIFLANVQLWARLLGRSGYPILGTFAGTRPVSGLAYYIQHPAPIYSGNFDINVAIVYSIAMIVLSMLFAKFWVETAGMDSKTVARKLQQSGMAIPGFRGDIRIIERVLSRYIPPVTLLGGAAVGMLAVFGDVVGALGRGTGVLLTVGILYQLYEQIAKEQLMELHPMIRKVMGGLEI